MQNFEYSVARVQLFRSISLLGLASFYAKGKRLSPSANAYLSLVANQGVTMRHRLSYRRTWFLSKSYRNCKHTDWQARSKANTYILSLSRTFQYDHNQRQSLTIINVELKKRRFENAATSATITKNIQIRKS